MPCPDGSARKDGRDTPQRDAAGQELSHPSPATRILLRQSAVEGSREDEVSLLLSVGAAQPTELAGDARRREIGPVEIGAPPDACKAVALDRGALSGVGGIPSLLLWQ